MWCRAVLVTAVALTCTFDTTVQAHGPTQIKDILCVLILNGMQKEDLDVNTLKKLQRHNVNIDDMNNEELRKECETVTRNASTNPNADEPDTHKTIPPDLREKQEDQKIKLSDSNLQNIIINYFNNVQKTNKPNYDNEKNKEPKSSTSLPNIENFMNVWSLLSKTRADVETTTITIESSTVLIDRKTRPNMHSDDKSIKYINNILEKRMAIQKTTATRSTTKSVDFDTIAQKIKDLLANTSNNEQNDLSTRFKVAEDEFGTDKVNEEKVLHNDPIKYIDDIKKLTNPFEHYVVNIHSSNRNMHIEDKNVYQSKRRHLVDDVVGPLNIITNAPTESQRHKNHLMNRQMKSLSEDIIRDISESVRARVLEDLQKVITTTKRTKIARRSTTFETTTAGQTEKPTTVKVKYKHEDEKIDATDMLETFMQMFQQFKASKDINEIKQFKITEDMNSKRVNHPSIANLPAPNIYNTKLLPVNLTSVIINPYNQIHTPLIQTAVLPNEPYTLLNMNTPIQNVPIAKPQHKITQLNIFNTKNNYHTSPITIQTNAVEVPPLGMPAQQSVVYQNIVVSTKHPLEKARHDFHDYNPRDRKRYNGNKHEELQPYPPQPKELYNEFKIIRHDRSRELINKEYSKDINRHKPIKNKTNGRYHYSDHNIERFHEKLERTDDWPRISRSREKYTDYYDDSPKLIPRAQLPLGSAKKRSRYNDAHFRNFLQTQQKVNDMLERILATKTITNGPRSVETTA